MPQKHPDGIVQKIAYLTGEGMTQQEIGDELGIPQGTVSKLLDKAQTVGWLKKTIHFVPKDMSAEEVQMIKAEAFPYVKKLKKNLSGLVVGPEAVMIRKVHVFYSGPTITSQAQYDKRLGRFGRAAAACVADLLLRGNVVGVTWGKTIANVMQGVSELFPQPPLKREHPTRFIPVCGILPDAPEIEFSSSMLAIQLHKIINGSEPSNIHSLGGVPARIPPPQLLSKKEATGLQAFIQKIVRGYREIFLGSDALINKMDCLLTGVGTAYQESDDPWQDEMTRLEGIAKEKLDELTVGDIGGFFLSKHNPPTPEEKVIQDFNERWTGIKVDHVHHCAWEAAKRDRPGVVIVGIGKRKAEVVRECIRRGLVNELVIDHDLAKELSA